MIYPSERFVFFYLNNPEQFQHNSTVEVATLPVHKCHFRLCVVANKSIGFTLEFMS